MSYAKLLKHTCEVYRYCDRTVDDVTHKVAELKYSGIKCRLSHRSVSNSDQNGRVVISTICILLLGKKVDIKNGDLVSIGNVKYKVEGPYQPGGHHTSVIVKREDEA